MEQKAYIVKHLDLETRMASRSGGIFTAVSDVILEAGGVVYGSAVNDKFQAEHRRGTTKMERNSFRGSKYVQSSMGDCYKHVKTDLANGTTVLFSGTGCQVNGLKSFLGEMANTDELLTMDIVCHGVPSPMIWSAFLSWMERKYHGKIETVNFRDKRYGWMAHFETVMINGKSRVADYYRAMFYKHYTLRPSCYECPFANLNRKGDLSIADAWGIDGKHSDFNDDKGCSLVLLNTEKGVKYFHEALGDIEQLEVPISKFMQPNLVKPSSRPVNRASFWNDFYENGFDFISRKYGMNTPKGRMISRVKRLLGKTHTTKLVKKVLKK